MYLELPATGYQQTIVKNMTLLCLLGTIMLAACQPKAEDPREVAERFWHAMMKGDTEQARQYVSRESQPSLDLYINHPSKEKTHIGEVNVGSAETRVVTVIYPDGLAPDDYRAFDTYLILEDGRWKIDAGRSRIPPVSESSDRELEKLAEELSESMQDNIDSMEEAMSEGMQMLNEALRDGSKEMGESMLKGLEEMNRAMRESIEDMRRRHEQQKLPPPDEKEGEGVI